jgi:hypothetical protein
LIQLPYSLYFVHRSVREGAISRAGAVLALMVAAPLLVLGPGALYFIAGGGL